MSHLRSIPGGLPSSTRMLCEASYHSSRLFAGKHEMKLNAASFAGLLLVAAGDPLRALFAAKGNDDFMIQVRAYLLRAVLEGG